jgi:tRNA-dihydrouridine synthase
VTIHARTAKEMSKVPARWEFIKRAVEIRDEMKSETLIFGNGDVIDINDARKKIEETGCDGVMLGRAIFGNPWLFNDGYLPSLKERLETLSEHIRLFDEKLGHAKNFAIMKKHFKAYVKGFDEASELRSLLMNAQNAEEAVGIINNFLNSLSSNATVSFLDTARHS